MDFFDFLFGKKGIQKNDTSSSATHGKSSQYATATTTPMDPVELFVKESVADLKKHMALNTKNLEAEAIYLAAFLYMKGSYQIDFELDYLSDSLLDEIPSRNFDIADKVFSYMIKYGEGYYGKEEQEYGISGYKMNIRMCADYGNYIKNYFIRAHKIGSGNDYNHFSSPRNCLWRNGVKSIESPTQRDIYYKFNHGTFEFMIPPYNPLVVGHVTRQTDSTIHCESNDGRRTFVFHFIREKKPCYLDYIEMYRNDKGDMVSYHKD